MPSGGLMTTLSVNLNMTEGKAFDLSADLGRSHPPRALKQNVSI